MKRMVLVFLILTLACSGLAGCVNPLERAIENASGGKVDIDGDTVTFRDDEGNQAEIGAGKWPDYEMAKNIPVFKECKVVSAVQANEVVMITLEEIDTKAFDAYLQQIKETFGKDAVDGKMEDLLTYVGTNADGIAVSIYYSPEEGEAVINVGRNAQ